MSVSGSVDPRPALPSVGLSFNQYIMNNAISETKNTLEATNSRITKAEDRISELEDRMVEINESERTLSLSHQGRPCPWNFSGKEYWSGLSCPPPGDLPDLGIEPTSPALAGGFFTTEPSGKP